MEKITLNPIKALFVDLDGTLLSHDLSISDLNYQAINQAHQNGIEIILASGRPVQAIAQTASLLGVGRYIIASNGGCIVDLNTDEIINFSPLSLNKVIEVADLAYEYGATPTIYSPTKWYTEKLDQNVAIEVKRANIEPEIRSFDSISDPIIKILIISKQFPSKSMELKINKISNSQLEWLYTYPEYLEVMQKTASKGKARDFLIDLLGITKKETVALGDGDNDYTLIKGAGIGVAMANASEKTKNAATYITPSNEENGVAVAIFGLIFNQTDFLNQLKIKL